VALVAAGFTKGLGLLLLPLFCRRYGRGFLVAAAAALVYIGMPIWVYMPQFMHGMKQYLETVHVNSGLFYGLDQAISHINGDHFRIVSFLSNASILGVMLWAALRPGRELIDLLRRAFLVIAVTLLVVPTLFPWYLLWLLPFLPLLRERPSWAFVLLSWLISFVYIFYISMRPYWWISVVEYTPFYLLLFFDYLRWRRDADGDERMLTFSEMVAAFHPLALWREWKQGGRPDITEMGV
jgi:hypothetical protein